ncbi:hypothetical protein ACFYPH_02665 [Micromonospora sp. NPDC005252]|uniref:hypothetical protein n=1 Tax=Micromonospora sp. NPDC005252 TaxID=3364228 RepID=UPI0036A3100D
MRIDRSLSRTLLAAFVAGVAVVGLSTPAYAEDDAHATALAAATAALQTSASSTGLTVDWAILATLSTEELLAIPESVPTDPDGIELQDPDPVESGALGQPPADWPTPDGAGSASGGDSCKTNGATLYFKGGVTRAKLWRFTESVYYCYNYGRRTITRISTPDTAGYIYGPGQVQGWKYRGVRSGPNNVKHTDLYGVSYYTSYVQAQFELCTVRLACVAESDPWIRLYSYRDGSVRAEKGGV